MPTGIDKNWKGLNVKLDAELFEELEKYTKQTERTKTWVVEKALKQFLNANQESEEK